MEAPNYRISYRVTGHGAAIFAQSFYAADDISAVAWIHAHVFNATIVRIVAI